MQTKLIVITILLLCLAYKISSKLVYVSTAFRHGARYPLSANYDIYDSNQTRNMSGTLSSVGMRQLYLLGSYMKADYIDQTNFINSTLFPKEVEIYASPSLRCQHSALSYLVGLFPFGAGARLPENLSSQYLQPPFQQHLSKHIRDEKSEQINAGEFALKFGFQSVPYTTPPNYFYCSNQNELVKQRFEAQKVKLAQFQANQTQFVQRLKLMLNLKPQYTTLLGLTDVYDVIVSDMYLGRKIPDTFTDRDLKQLTYIQAYLFTLIYKETLGHAFASSIMNKVLMNMENVVKKGQNQVKRFTAFSGHDTNIVCLLTFLNLTSAECIAKQWNNQTVTQNCAQVIPFASNLVLQLHQSDTNPGKYYVKAKYNGDYYSLCERNITECSWEEFSARVRYQFVDYNKYCGPITNVQNQGKYDKNNRDFNVKMIEDQ